MSTKSIDVRKLYKTYAELGGRKLLLPAGLEISGILKHLVFLY